jgi:hypothetical protein
MWKALCTNENPPPPARPRRVPLGAICTGQGLAPVQMLEHLYRMVANLSTIVPKDYLYRVTTNLGTNTLVSTLRRQPRWPYLPSTHSFFIFS